MNTSFLPAWPLEGTGALTVALLALVAAALGEVAARIRVPRLVGYSIASLLFALMAAALAGVGLAPIDRLLAEQVLGVMGAIILFDVGQRVSWGWLRRNPALLATSALECALTFLIVFALLRVAGFSALAAALAAAIAVATSPAVALSVTRELRAQGQVTERSLLLTALNTVFAVLASTVLLAWVHVDTRGGVDNWVLHPLYLLFGSLALAAGMARLMLRVLAAIGRERATQIVVVFAFVALVYTLAQTLRLSPLLALLTCGAFARAFDRERNLLAAELGLPAAIALVLFFALSLTTIDLRLAASALPVAVALVLLRALCKIFSTTALARASGLAWGKGALVGLALTPMSAVSLLLLRETAIANAQLAAQVAGVIIGAVLLMQIGGAFLLAFALRRAGEVRPQN